MNKKTDDGINEWLRLLRGQVSAKRTKEMLSEGLANLDAFIESDPHTEQRVVDILSRRLSGQITSNTWDVMHASLSQYFTEDLAYLLYWVVIVEDPTVSKLKEVEQYATQPVMAFLRAVVGIFCADLTRAFNMWSRVADDWNTIHREVYFDMIKQRHHVKIRLEKYNGKEVFLEGPANFVLNLANALIYTARLIGTAQAFSKDSIDGFLHESKELTTLLTAKKKK